MKERIITAIWAGAIFLGILLFAPQWAVSLFFFALSAAAAWECARLLGLNARGAGLILLPLALGCAFAFFNPLWAYVIAAVALVLWLIGMPYALYTYQKQEALPRCCSQAELMLMCLLQFIGFFAASHLLYAQLGSHILFVFALIWISDSGAYFVGRRWGRSALASKISPKKTIEGLAGGFILALLASWLLYAFHSAFGARSFWFYSAAVVLAVAMGVVGDLWESILKRRANIKDSGTLLPGHGGIFDRIDSWIAAFPFFLALL